MKTNQMPTVEQENLTNGVGRLNQLSDREGYLLSRILKASLARKQRLVHEHKGAANWLLFTITIMAIAGVLGSVIFFAIHQNQPSSLFRKIAPVSSQS